MIRSGAGAIALAATCAIVGCNDDQSVNVPTPSIIYHMDSVVLAARARGDTEQVDYMTAIEIPFVFGAPWSNVGVALDTFEVQRTFEVNYVVWAADAYAIVDTANADTLLVFSAASDDNGTDILRSDREGSTTAGVLISGDSLYFAPRPPAIHIAITDSPGTACPTPQPTRNPLIAGLRFTKCRLISINATDTLTTVDPQPGYLASIWLSRELEAVALIR